MDNKQTMCTDNNKLLVLQLCKANQKLPRDLNVLFTNIAGPEK